MYKVFETCLPYPLTDATRFPDFLTETVNGQTLEVGPNISSHCLFAENFSPANKCDVDSIRSCFGLSRIQKARSCLELEFEEFYVNFGVC